MPTYITTNPQMGKKLKLTGDSPPTEQDLEEIFGRVIPPLPAGFSIEVADVASQWFVQQQTGGISKGRSMLINLLNSK